MTTTTGDMNGSEASRATEPGSYGNGPRTRSRAPGRLPAVLVVDDVADNVLALEGMLRRDDIDIVTAQSGREALEAFLQHDVAVAIIDVMMPEMDGFELAELIRGVDRTRHVPIIFVTAGSKAEYRVFTGYQTGAIDFLFKPLDERVLRAKVDVLVTLEKQRRQLDLACEQAERARAETALLLRLARATGRCEKPDDVYALALDAVCEIFGAERSAILLPDAAGVMRFQAWRGLSDTYLAAVDGHSCWSSDEENPQAILVSDVDEDGAMASCRSIFGREGVRAVGFIPLLSERRLLGKFILYWNRPRLFSTHEKDLALAVAAQIAQAVSRTTAHAELEQTLRYNEIFAGILAHDLRNPLGAILMAAQHVLHRHEGDENVTRPVTRIVSSGTRMTRMIEQLLDFTRARVGGGIELEPREVDLADVCGQAVGELEVAHPEWKITVESLGDLRGTWDPDRLLQVVSNLVANAGQHGTSGGAILLKLNGSERDSMALEVHNGGCIKEALLPNLFAPFRGARDRKAEGLGLGLFITKDIVVGHGGTVDVTSSDAAGTVFEIRLPRHTTPVGRGAHQ